MFIRAIGAGWCSKCQKAKEYLKDIPIEWFDENSYIGKEITKNFGVKYIPFFIVDTNKGKEYIFESALKLKQFYLENKND